MHNKDAYGNLWFTTNLYPASEGFVLSPMEGGGTMASVVGISGTVGMSTPTVRTLMP